MKSLEFAKHLGTRLILAVVLLVPMIAAFTSPVFADEGSGRRAVLIPSSPCTEEEEDLCNP